MAFLATILAISCVTRYSLCAYQRLFIDSSPILVPFHASVAHAVPAVLPTMHRSPNVSLSGVIYCINFKHRQNSVVSESARQSSVHVRRMSCTAAAAAWQWAAEWEESHLVNTSSTGVSN